MNSFRIGPQFPQINKIRNMKMYFTRIIRIAHLPIASSVCSMLTHIYICMWLYDNNVMCVVCFVYFLLPSTSLSIYKTTEYQCHSRVHADEYVNVWVYYSLPQIVAHATTTEWTEKKCQTPNYEFGLRHFLLFLCSEGSWHWVWLLYGAMCHALLYVCVSAVRSSCGDVDRTTTVGSACTHFWLLAAGFYYSNIVHLYMFTLVHYCAVRYAIQTYAVAANELNRSQHTMMAFGFFFGGYIYMLYAKMMSSC